MATDEIVAAAAATRRPAARPGSAWARRGVRRTTARSTQWPPRPSRGRPRSGLETCVTLGHAHARAGATLAAAGLDYYNHNLDTSPEFYGEIITTRTYDDRLDTLANVRDAGIKVCCGGIVGMGETRRDRAGLLAPARHARSASRERADQPARAGAGHAAARQPQRSTRSSSCARSPPRGSSCRTSVVRLSAGRAAMTDELQALCLHAGANSIFLGDKLLTTPNPGGYARSRAAGPHRHHYRLCQLNPFGRRSAHGAAFSSCAASENKSGSPPRALRNARRSADRRLSNAVVPTSQAGR